MAGEVVIGLDCKAYVSTAGGVSSPTWVELSIIGQVKLSSSYDEVTIAERALADKLTLPAKRDVSYSFHLTRRPGNTQYNALRAAYQAKTRVAFAFMDGAIATAGSHGYQADMTITGWEEDQSNEGEGVDVTVKPHANYSAAPAFATTA